MTEKIGLEESEQAILSADNQEQQATKPIISIKDLDVVYFMGKSNEVHALKKINLEIYSGEFIIFFGPSGCGKSTLLYSVAGLETNTHGQIFIEDKELTAMKPKEIEHFHRSKMGMIFQAYYLIASLSVLNNVLLPQIFINGGREERKNKALELLERFGVKAQANKLPNELSGGQQQRVAICRSLMNDPDIILADEPVGNLDSNSSNEVMKLLGDLNEQEKKTIVLVTHNPEHLRFAHRIFFIKDGAVIETKVNKIVDRSIEKLVLKEVSADKPEVSRELELLMRTYSNLSSAQAGNLLVPFKARQIVLETLIGMSAEEVEKIQKKVENLLMRGIDDNDEIYQYLDIDIDKGGMGFDKRAAKKLTDKVKSIVGEIKFLEEEEIKLKERKLVDTHEEIVQVRQYLLDVFSFSLSSIDALKAMDLAIEDRLDNKIDRLGFQKSLDLPIEKGGAGFDKRTAIKMSKRMELLILGKYK